MDCEKEFNFKKIIILKIIKKVNLEYNINFIYMLGVIKNNDNNLLIR